MPFQLIMFSKMLQSYDIRQTAKAIRELGLSGVDLTVRPGGHVNPEQVSADLPEAITIFKDEGLEVPMITTAITSSDDPTARCVMETAACHGVKFAKLGYWDYEGFGTIKPSLEKMNRDLDGLETMASSIGIKLGLHTHSGNYLTADPVMIWSLIKDRNPAVMGAYLDAGHMFTEGRYGVWRIGLDLLSDRLFMVAVKDMTWGLPESGQSTPRQHPQVVPVGQGDVRWADFFRNLRTAGFYGPISIHSEYSSMDAAEIAKQTAQDLQYFRQVFDKVESV